MKIYPGLCVMSQEGTWIIMVFGVESGFWESDSSAGFSVSWIRPYLIFALRGNSEQPYSGHFLPPHFHFPFRINQFDTKWQFQKIDTQQTIPITVFPILNIRWTSENTEFYEKKIKLNYRIGCSPKHRFWSSWPLRDSKI